MMGYSDFQGNDDEENEKVSGQALPSNAFISITTFDIYGKDVPHPSLLFHDSDHHDQYFFTRLKKANKHDRVYSRTSGKGVWAECGGEHMIFDTKRGLLGFWSVFRYEGQTNHEWLLKEYTLANKFKYSCVRMEYVDFVLCMVKRNPKVEVDPDRRSDWFLDKFFDDILKQRRSLSLKTSSSAVDPSHDSTVAEGTNDKRI
ncbi:UNVERIFIED_CONTAM: hypothetical protein Slati_3203200 [Sesamum latifolium]|uniref:NAC domain-containing protein n=1 Tax=Sesamum latifolium TaxID=2727402 RepID=A0AAW2UYQ0_9LAMI